MTTDHPMTPTPPPVSPGSIRIIIHVPKTKTQIYVDLETSKLPYCLGDLIDGGAKTLSMPAPTKGTDEGAIIAREMFVEAMALGENGYGMACIVAAWICLHAPPCLPGYGLQLDELEAAAGHGVLRAYVKDDAYVWEHDFAAGDVHHGGRKIIPRQPHWSSHPPAGTA
jgi:hypothetical protein